MLCCCHFYLYTGWSTRKAYYKKLIKNESLINRYNFSTVNATNFLFSPLHTTPFLYRKTYVGFLNYLLAIVAWSDTSREQNHHIIR